MVSPDDRSSNYGRRQRIAFALLVNERFSAGYWSGSLLRAGYSRRRRAATWLINARKMPGRKKPVDVARTLGNVPAMTLAAAHILVTYLLSHVTVLAAPPPVVTNDLLEPGL
jgi:hypothetical protein